MGVRAWCASGAWTRAGDGLRSGPHVPGRRRSPRLRHLALAAGAALARARGERSTARRLLQRAADEAERLAARILDEEWRASFWGGWGGARHEAAAREHHQGATAPGSGAGEARARRAHGRGA